MRRDILTDEEYIEACEKGGLVDPDCRMCLEIFYPAIREGKAITDVFAPPHKASERCRSGKSPHCTCDTCF